MRFFIDLFYWAAILVLTPKMLYRMLRHGRYRTGWSQRLGKIQRRHPDRKCIWLHAVSVGEVNATKTLLAALRKDFEDFEIVISSTTDTGLVRAKNLYAKDHEVFFFPFDISIIMQRAFARIKPDICLLMELEVWPNMADIAKRRSIPLVVVNGRLSEKSFPRYKMIRAATKWMFNRVTLFCVQTEEYAKRFRDLGAPHEKVIITSSLKYDTAQTTDTIEGSDQLKKALNIGDEKIWVVGGTGPGEEQIILKVFAKLKNLQPLSALRLAIVPRKPERFEEVAQQITRSGFSFTRYSKLRNAPTPLTDKPEIILVDTMGDLKKFYSLATVVFVGRTLVPMGGSDMMEPAAMGKCTVFGPHTFNFKQTVDALLKGDGAVMVENPDELFHTTKKALLDNEFTQNIAQNGRTVITQNQGATQKTIKAIKELYPQTGAAFH